MRWFRVVFALVLSLALLGGGVALFIMAPEVRDRTANAMTLTSSSLREAHEGLGELNLLLVDLAGFFPQALDSVSMASTSLTDGQAMLDGLIEAGTELSGAMQLMASDLRTLSSSIGGMLGSDNRLAATAGELDDAATQITETVPIATQFSRDIRGLASSVALLREQLGRISRLVETAPRRLQELTDQLSQLEGDLADPGTAVEIPRYATYAVGGLLIILGLALFWISALQRQILALERSRAR